MILFWENVAFVYVCFAPTQIHYACKQNIVLYSKRPINGPYSSNTFGTGTKRKRTNKRTGNNEILTTTTNQWISNIKLHSSVHFLHSIHLFGSSSLTQCSHVLPFFRRTTIHEKIFYWIAEKVSQANVDKIQSLVEPAIGKTTKNQCPQNIWSILWMCVSVQALYTLIKLHFLAIRRLSSSTCANHQLYWFLAFLIDFTLIYDSWTLIGGPANFNRTANSALKNNYDNE